MTYKAMPNNSGAFESFTFLYCDYILYFNELLLILSENNRVKLANLKRLNRKMGDVPAVPHTSTTHYLAHCLCHQILHVFDMNSDQWQ